MAEFTFDANNYLFVTSVGSGGGGTNVNVFDSAGNAITSTAGSLNVNVTNSSPTAGTLSNNTAPPAANNVGVLPAVANAAAPTLIEGNQVLLSVDLAGNLRTTTSIAPNASVNVNQWAGVQLGAPTNFGTTPGAVIAGSVNSSIFAGTTGITATGTSLNANITNTVPVTLASTTITGNVTVVQPTGTNLHVVVDSTTGTAAENLIQVAGVTLGATAVTAYGTAPAAANVPGVNAFITNTPAVTLASTTITGNVTVVQPTGTNLHVVIDSGSALSATVVGTLTNNNAAPAANNLGVLPALANAASPTWTEGDQVLESVDLTGRQRVRGTLANNAIAPTSDNVGVLPASVNNAQPAYTDTRQALLSINPQGFLRVANSITSLAGADASTNTSNVLLGSEGNTFSTLVRPSLFNGTTWDRQRTAGVGNNVAATGLAADVAYGNVTTAAPTYTTATYSALSLDTAGNLRVTPTAIGTLTNNNAAPGSVNVGVLPALANAANPAWTEGNQVLLSVDLSGRQRIMGQVATAATFTGSPVIVGGVQSLGSGLARPVSTDVNGGVAPAGTTGSLVDGQSNSGGTWLLNSAGNGTVFNLNLPYVFNGTTWDRTRSATIGNAVAATGLQISADYGQYLSTAPAPTTGQYSAMQQDAFGCIITKHIRRSQIVRTATTIANSAAATTVIAAQAAGIFADMSALIISVLPLAAGAAPITFTATLSDGTINYIYDLQATQIGTAVLVSNPTSPLNIAYNPSLPATTAATAWTVTLSVATVTVHITALAIQQKAN